MGGAAGALLVGRYRVVRPLGQGGMGSVWLAEDAQLENRQIAIKMLPSILVSNKRAYNQLKAEALVSLKLTHPNIATVRAFEENAGNPFLVVDYVDGQTLDDYLAEKGKLSEEETIRLLMPVAAALDYAHGEGVVHRDVKPANVMIRKDGHPFVLDFGIAREIQETLTRVTGKLSSGTLMYMSPEQLNGDVPSAAQDVYSFAAMVYECLTGAPPFVRGLVEDQIKSKIPTPIDPHIAICGSVMAGLAKSAEARPASCAAVLKRVEGLGNRVEGLGTTTNYVLVALLAAGLVFAGGGFWWYSERKQDRIRQEAESGRQRELVRMAEEKRIAEEKRRVADEERRIAEEEQRIAKEKALAEEKRAAEEKRVVESNQSSEQTRNNEKMRELNRAFNAGEYQKILHDPESETMPELRFMKGFLYQFALGVAPDLKVAEKLFGCPLGVCSLARMYIVLLKKEQECTPKCVEEVTALAERGDSLAMYVLCLAYRDGVGVPANMFQYKKWLEKSSESGNVVAQSSLAECYLKGNQAFAKDVQMARRWFDRSAEKGFYDAKLAKAVFLRHDGDVDGANSICAECEPIVRAYAEQGIASMQRILGEMYEKGWGLRVNLNDAEKWYRLSAEKGDSDARIKLERLQIVRRELCPEREVNCNAAVRSTRVRNAMPFEARIRPYRMESGVKRYLTSNLDGNCLSNDVKVWSEDTDGGQVVVVGAYARPKVAYSITISCGSLVGRVFVSGANFNGSVKEVLLR